jgi:hypothetical protein
MDARSRDDLTIVACVTPLLAPLAFAFASHAGLVGWVLQLVAPIIGANREFEAISLFLIGWTGWTLISASWIAHQMVGTMRTMQTRLAHVMVTLVFFLLFLSIAAVFAAPVVEYMTKH